MAISPTPAGLDIHQLESVLEHLEEVEAQLQQVRDGLTHSHRLATLGTLATIIAHEFNNILTPIISYAQLALATPGDHDLLVKAVEKALSGAERAAKISSSVLGFASQGDDVPRANVAQVVQDVLSCLGRHPSKDNINLTLDVPSLEVALTPLNLQQVLLNLVLNARKVMRPRGGSLEIRARQMPTNQVLIDVADTGPGVPEDIRDRIFEPFVTQRVAADTVGSTVPTDSHSEDETRGTGLGLSICRDIVHAAGGRIWFDTETGKGTTFHILLPPADPSPAKQQPKAA
ncbi:MAG: HAMP domain-containing histidine kinase [Phycisphaeraceae bacterium]|nr:HAMP domain-containing histidine kinase [Phycisphaeraceae bacterium]